MDPNASTFAFQLMRQIFRVFTSWRIPGTGVTPAAWALFLIIASLGIRFLVRLLGHGDMPDVGVVRSVWNYKDWKASGGKRVSDGRFSGRKGGRGR